MVQKTEHPAGLNKWGPLRVSNVLRPDNRVAAEPWVGWAHGGVCSVCGRAQWLWPVLGTVGVAGVCVYFWVRIRWMLGSSGVGAFCVRLWVYPVCYEVDSSPLFNFNRIFSPFPRSVPKPCAETSYLRVQCLCLATVGYAILCAGRRGYNTWCVWLWAPHGKWRRLPMAVLLLPRARGRKPLGKGHGLPGKICLYPLFPP